MLVVAGTLAQRSLIEDWLRQLCGQVEVDLQTGTVRGAARQHTPHVTGCPDLRAVIASQHRVAIVPLSNPLDAFLDDDERGIVRFGGGAALAASSGEYRLDNGEAGSGCSATVYIDVSENNGRGYPHPMWRILAHELTTGHAHQIVAGTHAESERGRERQARESENRHAVAHGLVPRPLP